MPANTIVVPGPIGELETNSFFFWHRLEPRARSDNFSRSIQAQVHDPLWLLTRQWQLGEFKGEDAGSPVNLKLKLEKRRLSRYSAGLPGSDVTVELLDGNVPLETTVERESTALDWRMRVQIGQQLERILMARKSEGQDDADKQDVQNVLDHFKTNYPLASPPEAERLETDDVTWRFREIMAGKGIDGGKLRQAGLISANPVVPNLQEPKRSIAVAALKILESWHNQFFAHEESSARPPWRHDQLEYEFSVSSPREAEGADQRVLVAPEFAGGSLDWHAFSAIRDRNVRLGPDEFAGEDRPTDLDNKDLELIPANISFRGMPNARWYEFEDRQTDFGNLDAGTTDLGKLIVMEFALIYSNDWFIIPVPLKIGSLCRVTKCDVTDVFGIPTQIRRAGSGPDKGWQKAWNMYGISFEKGKNPATASNNDGQETIEDFFLLPPTLGRSEESPALEEVRFLRDEMANMVWAVEHTLLNGLGEPWPGLEYHRDRQRREEERQNREEISRIQEQTTELGDLATEAAAAAARAAEATTPQALATATEEARQKLEEVQRLAAEAGGDISASAKEQDTTTQDVLIGYRLASKVPANWVPYIPVQTDQTKRAIQFRRAALVSESASLGPDGINPMTQILRSAPSDHRVKEEAISRAGTKIRLMARRTRWTDGSTHLWVGRKTGPSRGEGSSGLIFDYLFDKR